MDIIYSNLRKYFPFLSATDLAKVYKARLERLRILRYHNIPEDVCWLIEAKVRLGGETSFSFLKYMPGLGKSNFSKKRRAKQLQGCYKCARWTCDTRCKSVGLVSRNREDKINFIKDGLSKESLDDIRLTLETHPSGFVYRELLALWAQFNKEQKYYNLEKFTFKDHVCQFYKKLDEGWFLKKSLSHIRAFI